MTKTISFTTLGCKLNYAETSTYSRQAEREGLKKVAASKPADICIVNTCSVTEHADKKCRNVIRRLNKLNPDARIVVTGCYAQLKPAEIKTLPGVCAVIGAEHKRDVIDVALGHMSDFIDKAVEYKGIKTFFQAHSSGERTRSFLKVQDGCNYFCTYCTVPLARGISRNVSIASLVRQAEEIASSGIKEIVLTGVNTGDFGRTTGESFVDLLKALDKVEGIERYRISSIEPNLLTEEIVDWIAHGSKFLPHFHIPLQSGCDRILASMHRRYTTESFEDKINYIRQRMGNVFLGIDVIVGFPGETDDDFESTYHFLERIHPAFIHIFPYSRREGTLAAGMPYQVQDCVKTKRVQLLENLCARLYAEYCTSFNGMKELVLFESTVKGGLMAGYTRNYIRVERPYCKDEIGRVVEVTLP